MTIDQIRQVVNMTIDELEKRHLLKDPYNEILADVSKQLKQYFKGNHHGHNVSYALHQLSDDPYIDIIYLIYRDDKTVEWVSEYYDVEARTILRNKKRLIMTIYNLIKE